MRILQSVNHNRSALKKKRKYMCCAHLNQKNQKTNFTEMIGDLLRRFKLILQVAVHSVHSSYACCTEIHIRHCLAPNPSFLLPSYSLRRKASINEYCIANHSYCLSGKSIMLSWWSFAYKDYK